MRPHSGRYQGEPISIQASGKPRRAQSRPLSPEMKEKVDQNAAGGGGDGALHLTVEPKLGGAWRIVIVIERLVSVLAAVRRDLGGNEPWSTIRLTRRSLKKSGLSVKDRYR
eukprot:GHVN01061247.1.p1 GENE.GHVN01061247.1~~GHVN01061247.1.p1  ORF type:complete len:111 (+),score=7.70 GHVN01061247.1:277-609(+)